MRPLLVVALLLALVSGGAAAQADEVEPEVTVSMGAFEAPVMPLEGLGGTTVDVSVSCALLLDEPLTGKAVALTVVEAPTWSTVTLSPSTVVASQRDCEGDTWRATVSLLASTTAEAPAFTPADVRVRAELAHPAGPYAGEGATPVQAGYFSILDTAVLHAQHLVAPREVVEAPVTVVNHGNGATRVRFEVIEAPDDWRVVAPAPMVLEAEAEGGTQTQQESVVRVEPRVDAGYVNTVGVISLRVTSAYASDATLTGDEGGLSIMVTVKGLDTGNPVPGVGVLLALGAAAWLLALKPFDRRGART